MQRAVQRPRLVPVAMPPQVAERVPDAVDHARRILVPGEPALPGELDRPLVVPMQRVEDDVADDPILLQPGVAFVEYPEPGIDAEPERMLPEQVAAEPVNRSDGRAVDLPHQLVVVGEELLPQLLLQVVRRLLGEGDGRDLRQPDPPVVRAERDGRGPVGVLPHGKPKVPEDLGDHRGGLARPRVGTQHGVPGGLNGCRLFGAPPHLSHRTGSIRSSARRCCG